MKYQILFSWQSKKKNFQNVLSGILSIKTNLIVLGPVVQN